MTIPKVSVVIPAFRAEAYLPEAIDTVLSQTFTDFELLIVVDDPNDECSNIVNEYSKKDPRVSLIHNTKNAGIAGALDTGMDNAKGQYIIRMDADDICVPSRFKKQVTFMDKNPEIGVCGSWMSTFGDKKTRLWYPFPLNNNRIKVAFLFYTAVAHPTLIIRKSIFDQHNLKYDENLRCAEDYDLWTRAIAHCQFANLKDKLLSYRIHSSNASASRPDEHRTVNINILKRQLSKIGIDPTDEEVAIHMSLYWGPYGDNEDFIQNAEQWLLKLITANKTKPYFDQKALQFELRKVFFKVCRGAALRGGFTRALISPLFWKRKTIQS